MSKKFNKQFQCLLFLKNYRIKLEKCMSVNKNAFFYAFYHFFIDKIKKFTA